MYHAQNPPSDLPCHQYYLQGGLEKHVSLPEMHKMEFFIT